MNILAKLNEIFQDVFEDDELEINSTTSASDVDGWDSLMHVSMIVNVEREFGVRFPSSKVSKLANVGELIDLIESVQ
jgi:acyl carrier protein